MKKYKKIASFLFFCLPLLIACNSSRHITITNDKELVDQFKEDSYKLYYTVDDIDSRLIKYMRHERNYDLIMIDTGKVFNPSDMIIKDFPNKRLIVAGTGSNTLNFILYEYGENMSHHTCVLYRRHPHKKYTVSLLSISDTVNTFEKLKKAIVSQSFSLRK